METSVLVVRYRPVDFSHVTPDLETVLQSAVFLVVLFPRVLLVSRISAIFISLKTVFHKVLNE
jgi:hypothetical protein